MREVRQFKLQSKPVKMCFVRKNMTGFRNYTFKRKFMGFNCLALKSGISPKISINNH